MNVDTLTLNRLEELAACTHVDIDGTLCESAHTPAIALPSGVAIHSLEQYLPAPTRFQGAFSTDLHSAFLAYCEEHAGGDSRIFLDTETMSARAIFDLGNPDAPKWGKHSATLTLKRTPAFEAVLTNAKAHTQREILDFFEDWADHVALGDGQGNDIDFRKGLSALRKVSIKQAKDGQHEVGDFSAKRSVLEMIEVSSEENLPGEFKFNCAPYTGFNPRQLHCRLRVSRTTESPVFTYRIIQLDEVLETIALEFRARLIGAEELEDIRVHIGTFRR